MVTAEVWEAYRKNRDIEIRNYILGCYMHIVNSIASQMCALYKNIADREENK